MEEVGLKNMVSGKKPSSKGLKLEKPRGAPKTCCIATQLPLVSFPLRGVQGMLSSVTGYSASKQALQFNWAQTQQPGPRSQEC